MRMAGTATPTAMPIVLPEDEDFGAAEVEALGEVLALTEAGSVVGLGDFVPVDVVVPVRTLPALRLVAVPVLLA